MSYLPIENHGIIGDLHTTALVGTDGTIDWLCLPQFDSPSVFAAILDDEKGGWFRIEALDDKIKRRQFYWPGTNVLITHFLSPDGVGEIADFMPIEDHGRWKGEHPLIRRVRCLRGSLQFRAQCRPAFDFARAGHTVRLLPEGAAFDSQQIALGLASTVPLQADGQGVRADFTLAEGETAVFVLQQIGLGGAIGPRPEIGEVDDLFEGTVAYWRHWLEQGTYHGRWREMVDRSALVLKLLTFEPTGAIVAAPTCSLPEYIGGERNWDYRYTWIRDAAFTVYALMRIGFTHEATKFMGWLEDRCHELEPDGSLQIMYGIDGRHNMAEETLDHLAGYRGSKPVRVGNGAFRQRQLDIYGELLDSVYLYNKYGSPISYQLWEDVSKLVNWITRNWRTKDQGVWEMRGASQDFVYSKVMCWVALDRALRLADKRSFPSARAAWLVARDQIYIDVIENGWNSKLNAFTQSYGSDALDASNLIMPLVFFMAPNDPKMEKTLAAILKAPSAGGLVSSGLVYRYHTGDGADGFECEEGSFNMCTFWLVEALTRAGRIEQAKLEEARLIFEQMLGYANHLGLYSEQTGPCGEALGNFPQALTHLALISAAVNLDRELGEA
ncbi:MAG TPA: glycoside hydrolase family 15 protein [Candidatus Dormibacteraeota bacterium]|nr:glycoside hydrolase family 15 protein [Candidatus Dormibacteraeota bacterium]